MRASPLLIAVLCASPALAQELDPRAYSPAPTRTAFLIAGIGGSEGAVLFDPSLPVDAVHANLTIATTTLGYTFGLAQRQARVLAAWPLAWGEIAGDVGGRPERQPMHGLVDPRFKFSLGLRGSPALSPEEFGRARRSTVIGASLTVVPPLGQYDAGRLVNLGYNRWAFKPEIGVSRPFGRWTIEGVAGAWLFTENRAYFPGRARRSQDPMLSLQGHVSYALSRRSWVALNATWFAGGRTSVNGLPNPDEQQNLRLGATFSVPVNAAHSVKLSYSTGATTRRGSDFNTVTLQWQRVWF